MTQCNYDYTNTTTVVKFLFYNCYHVAIIHNGHTLFSGARYAPDANYAREYAWATYLGEI